MGMEGEAETKAYLNGFVKPHIHVGKDEWLEQDFRLFSRGFKALSFSTAYGIYKVLRDTTRAEIQLHDARKLQQESGLSAGDFFNKYGFVLLQHKTEMTEADWKDEEKVKSIYARETKDLIKNELNIADKYVVQNEYSTAIIRGPNHDGYGSGVHQDYGLNIEEVAHSARAYAGPESEQGLLKEYEECEGYMIINFWRPIEPMVGPIKQDPLIFCDRHTVRFEDVLPSRVYGFSPNDSFLEQAKLKYHKDQKYYMYPDLTKDEVLVHTQFFVHKGHEQDYFARDQKKAVGLFPSTFHSAIHLPDAPKDAEKRTSSEYRVNVKIHGGVNYKTQVE